jgi:hypothetical protein
LFLYLVGDLLSFFLAMMIEALVADPGGAEISFLDQVISDSPPVV